MVWLSMMCKQGQHRLKPYNTTLYLCTRKPAIWNLRVSNACLKGCKEEATSGLSCHNCHMNNCCSLIAVPRDSWCFLGPTLQWPSNNLSWWWGNAAVVVTVFAVSSVTSVEFYQWLHWLALIMISVETETVALWNWETLSFYFLLPHVL